MKSSSREKYQHKVRIKLCIVQIVQKCALQKGIKLCNCATLYISCTFAQILGLDFAQNCKEAKETMKSIEWKIVLTDDNKIASMENGVGLPQDTLESHLTIIGILENLKQIHLDKINTLFQKTVKKGRNTGDE